jgi:hypothetical protein
MKQGDAGGGRGGFVQSKSSQRGGRRRDAAWKTRSANKQEEEAPRNDGCGIDKMFVFERMFERKEKRGFISTAARLEAELTASPIPLLGPKI